MAAATACQSAVVGADRPAFASTRISQAAIAASAAAASRARILVMDQRFVGGPVRAIELGMAAERHGTEQVDRDRHHDQSASERTQRAAAGGQEHDEKDDVVQAEAISELEPSG